MAWYKVSITYGPGHQAKFEKYVWDCTHLSDDDKRELWEQYLSYDMDWPIGRVEPISELPFEIHSELVKEFNNKLNYAKGMLKILEKTSTKQE